MLIYILAIPIQLKFYVKYVLFIEVITKSLLKKIDIDLYEYI